VRRCSARNRAGIPPRVVATRGLRQRTCLTAILRVDLERGIVTTGPVRSVGASRAVKNICSRGSTRFERTLRALVDIAPDATNDAPVSHKAGRA
jgi:hypothetical protein